MGAGALHARRSTGHVSALAEKVLTSLLLETMGLRPPQCFMPLPRVPKTQRHADAIRDNDARRSGVDRG
ncbi:MAG: hypothetical protein ACI8PT_004994 [Gammaproteobacteria bacterium]|jgi:hypothetical protein